MRGSKAGSAASGVSQMMRQAMRAKRATASRHRGRIAALEAVREHDERRAARQRGKARHGEKGVERVANARAAVPVGDEERRGGERLFAVAQAERAG